MRIVIDPDVLLSGLRSPSGASRIILLAVRERVVTPLVNTAMLLEYESVLKRPENLVATELAPSDIDDLLDFWTACSEYVSRRSSQRQSVRDADDDLFAEAALTGHAEALVTFNVRDYVLAGPARQPLAVAVLRPGDFLRRLAWRPSQTAQSAFRLP